MESGGEAGLEYGRCHPQPKAWLLGPQFHSEYQQTARHPQTGRGSKERELKNYRENGNLGTRGELARAVIRKPGGDSLCLTFYS